MRISDWSSDVCSSDLSSYLSSGAEAVAGVVDHLFAVFLGEGAALSRRDEVEHLFRGTAELHTERRDDERPVDQDRMRHHCVDKGSIVEAFVAETEIRSEEHTSELQSLMRNSYAVFFL